MNKTAIKNFAIWARNKFIADITYKAGLLGITEKEIKEALPQSTKDVKFFDIGTKEPYSISGMEIKQREKLAETINSKAKQTDYNTAYKAVVEEVAYTWFNRLIAVRFMEVNDYLPSRIRVLSSESATKIEPDLVTTPFDSDMDFSPYEKDRIVQLKQENKLDELFQMLFIKQCNTLNAILPNLFQKTSDYTELLLNVSFTDKDGVVYRLVHDISEDDFNVSKEGQVEIIGWLYQYYNTEPKDEAFALLKKNVKITKERIPAATQLFTPDWIVRYMVENSLGRLWLEGHPNDELKSEWKYYLDEAEQEEDVQKQLEAIREEYKTIKPEDIKVIDPCMGSGHILVYAFDVLIQIYESYGYSQRDAARSILAHNIYGLDIDNRAYQLAYFALMMKARQYNRRILDGDTDCNVYSIQESNYINRNHLKYFGAGMSETERETAILQMEGLLDTFIDAKEYGSILNVENYNWELLHRFVGSVEVCGQLSFDAIGVEDTMKQLCVLVDIGVVMEQKYDVVMTNPPYMGSNNMSDKLFDFISNNYISGKTDLFAVFIERCLNFSKAKRNVVMITQQGWMFLSSYEKLREIIVKKRILTLMQLGARAFDEISGEVVQTCAFVINNSYIGKYISKFIRLVEYAGEAEKEKHFFQKKNSFLQSIEKMQAIPSSPLAYWASDKVLEIFDQDKPLSTVLTPRQGVKTLDNERFLKLWFEVSFKKIGFGAKSLLEANAMNTKWFPYNKGGKSRKWYGNKEYIVNWENDGQEMKAFAIRKYNSVTRTITNISYFFLPGITWSDVSTGNITVRYSDAGMMFDSTGIMAFGKEEDLQYIIGLMNSKVMMHFLNLIAPTLHFNGGTIGNVPYIFSPLYLDEIKNLTLQCEKIARQDWDMNETSWDFHEHPLSSCRDTALIEKLYENMCINWNHQIEKLRALEEQLNRFFIEIYDLKSEISDCESIEDMTLHAPNLKQDICSFISYAVGCMFGRYSLDVEGLVYAGGQWDESKYSTFIPDKDSILPITDEEYFQDDIVGLFVAFVKKVYGAETLEENLDFIAKALGNKGNTSREIIRNYFLKDFFKDHCKVYQKRPIYWLFDSGKANGFKALIYLHRYDENTIGNLRIDYLHRMQRVYESEIARMQETIENSTNAREVAAAEKRKEKLTKQLKETKEYDEKIAHLALARISIDLDDGVKVNYEKVQTGNDGKKLEVLAKI